tara:strand:- start:791 stop:1387 length:597 start_codon:yes stop_codon:yes gene_type:complete
MVLGLDFDNTIIRYDELFHKVALEKGLIPADLPKEKNTVRDHLRANSAEDEWTIIQGEVYGDRMIEAKPYVGMFDTLHQLCAKNIPIYIISHKTKIPYLGPKRDLHAAAGEWLKRHNFLSPRGLNWNKDQIFFEPTKEKKVERIIETGCTHYVDDLIEILELLPDSIHKILFSPNWFSDVKNHNWSLLKSWKELPLLL